MDIFQMMYLNGDISIGAYVAIDVVIFVILAILFILNSK